MKTATEFIKFALSHANPATVMPSYNIDFPVGNDRVWCYLYGTTGTTVTESLIRSRWNEHYSKQTSWARLGWDSFHDRFKQFIGSKATDCEGLLDAFLGTDVNADYCYKQWCEDKGAISDISRDYTIGEAVFVANPTGRMTHVGWICGFDALGNPLVVEARSAMHGVGVWRLKDRAFTHRGKVTAKLDYSGPEGDIMKPILSFEVQSPVASSDAYKAMQEALNEAGFTDSNGNILVIDGKWGKKSRQAFDKLLTCNLPYSVAASVSVGTVTYTGNIGKDT